jgi:hypothetical protein
MSGSLTAWQPLSLQAVFHPSCHARTHVLNPIQLISSNAIQHPSGRPPDPARTQSPDINQYNNTERRRRNGSSIPISNFQLFFFTRAYHSHSRSGDGEPPRLRSSSSVSPSKFQSYHTHTRLASYWPSTYFFIQCPRTSAMRPIFFSTPSLAMLSRRCLLSKYHPWACVLADMACRVGQTEPNRIRVRAHLYNYERRLANRAQISGRPQLGIVASRCVALCRAAPRTRLHTYLEYYAMFRIPDRPTSPRHAFKFPRPPGSPPHALGNQPVYAYAGFAAE